MHIRTARAAMSGAALVAGLLGAMSGMGSAQARPIVQAQPMVTSVPCSVPALISAIAAANASSTPSTLDLAPGCVYTLTSVNSDSDGLPVIVKDVTLVGSKTTIQRATDGPAFRILEVSGTGARLTVDGITVQNGLAVAGGCLLADNGGTLITASSMVTNCTAALYGGGIAVDQRSAAQIGGTVLLSNTAGSNGGAIYNGLTGTPGTGQVSVPGVTIGASRLTENGAGAQGGAIYTNSGSTTQIAGTTIDHNQATTRGGGLADYGSEVLRNSVVAANVVSHPGPDGGGGGIWEQNPNHTVLIVSLVIGNIPNNCRPGGNVPLCFT